MGEAIGTDQARGLAQRLARIVQQMGKETGADSVLMLLAMPHWQVQPCAIYTEQPSATRLRQLAQHLEDTASVLRAQADEMGEP